jgi:hypothetical protein
MPMNASGAPIGGGGSLHDIMRHISAQRKETKELAPELLRTATNTTTKIVDEQAQNRELKAMAQASVRRPADLIEQFAHAKSILEQLGPALLLRGGQRDQAAPSSLLGKRQREAAAATTTTTDDTDLDAYRRERDRLVAEMGAADAARTATSSSTSASTITNGNSVHQMRDLASVYLFGLERVGALQDLRQAPDAILPGNFVEQPVAAAAAAADVDVTTTVATTSNAELATTKSAEMTATTTTATETEGKTPVAVAASSETKTTAVADDPTK